MEVRTFVCFWCSCFNNVLNKEIKYVYAKELCLVFKIVFDIDRFEVHQLLPSWDA